MTLCALLHVLLCCVLKSVYLLLNYCISTTKAHENFNRIYARAFDSGLTAVIATSFVDSPDSALREIQRSGTKIIFGFFGPSDARKVLCRVRVLAIS